MPWRSGSGAGDVEAAYTLITFNLRFVVKVSLEYRGYGIKLLDMIQEENMGLMVVLKKFDPHKGYRFISYAIWIPAGAPMPLRTTPKRRPKYWWSPPIR